MKSDGGASEGERTTYRVQVCSAIFLGAEASAWTPGEKADDPCAGGERAAGRAQV